jgi:hypothetical protein
MAWLAARQADGEAVVVTYTRGAASAPVAAVVGGVDAFARLPDPSTRVDFTQRDYLVRAADLAAAGFAGDPGDGDRLAETINGAAVVFQVAPRDDGPAWRWSDPERTTYRIHTRPA